MNAAGAQEREDGIGRSLFGATMEWMLHSFDSLPSTSDRLKAMAVAGAREGTAIMAREQTQGRGQRDRRWYSARDKGLYLSVLLRPPWPAAEGAWLTVVATLAVLHTLCRQGIGGAVIEPPNDVLVGGRKIAGVLVEPRIGRGRIEFAVVGIGVNLAHEPADFSGAGLERLAVSCAMLDHPIGADVFAAATLAELAALYAETRQGNRDAVLEEWMHSGGSAELPGMGA